MGFFDLFRRRAGAAAAPSSPNAAPAADLTEREIALIQDSFEKVQPIADVAARLFYSRLFVIAPQTRALFPGDSDSAPMAEQGKKLMATLGAVVAGLRDLDAMLPVAGALARRHVDYGVQPEHYAPVGEALLWTLEQGLEDAFTTETKAAWAKAYGALSSAMIATAYSNEVAA